MADLFKRIMAAAAVAVVLASCAREALEISIEPEETPYTFLIGDLDTKLVLGSDANGRFGVWESGDRIGTLLTDTGNTTKAGYANITPGPPVSFTLYRSGGFSGGEKVRGYYPYNAATTGLQNVAMSIPVLQTQGADGLDFDAMPMVSDLFTVSAPVTSNYNPVGELYFTNLASVAEFKVFSTTSSYTSEKITSIRFEASSAIAGSFTADISGMSSDNPSSLAISGYTETSVQTNVTTALNPGSSLDNAASVMMVVAPGTYGGTVIVSTDKAVYRYPLNSQLSFDRSRIRSYGINLATCQDRTASEFIIVNKTIQQILTEMGQGSASNGTTVNPLAVDEAISLSTTGAGNNGKVYGTGTEWRIYAANGGNVVVSTALGYELRSVTITHSDIDGSAYSFEAESNVELSVTGRSATWQMNSGKMRITAISVKYVKVKLNTSVTTSAAKHVRSSSAILPATYKDVDMVRAPQAKGFYWGTSSSSLNNTLYDNDTVLTDENGSFEIGLYGLEPSTTYYFKAFMTVWKDGKYKTITGSVKNFTTSAASAGERVYMDCYEMPAVSTTVPSCGPETFGSTYWYAFKTNVSTQMVVTHTYEYDGRVYRNYTSCMDQNKRCPLWVAYPMHGGSYPRNFTGRKGDFSTSTSYDPAIPKSWQSSGSTDDYNSSTSEGFARGHLCASSDRQTDENGNKQTFYYTNQAPQWQKNFNDGVWNDLETAVQNKSFTLASSDTLYVVSGTLFDPLNMHASNDNGEVARPSHFYKLLMLCHFDNSGEIVSAEGAAYLYTNEAHTDGYSNSAYRTTINAVETRAGFDFFAAVPSGIQEAAESSFSSIL